MPEGYMDAAAVPVPDGGDDTLREQLAEAISERLFRGGEYNSITIGRYTSLPGSLADALLPLIREHTAAAVQGERERVSALLASIPDEYYPQDVFGGPLSYDESRQANELLQAEGLPTYDRVSANAMRHAWRIVALLTLEEPDHDR